MRGAGRRLEHVGSRVVKTGVGAVVRRRAADRIDLPLSHWDLAIGANERLWSGPLDLEVLARREGTPLHVARGDLLDRNVDAALRRRAAGPRCDAFYSYKTNPVPGVLARMHARGVGAEVISAYELWLALRLGVPPQRIVYNGPAKTSDSIRLAIRRGVLLINANSASEAELIAGLAAAEEHVVNLGVRVALPGMWSGQFGIAADSPLVTSAVQRAAAHPFVALRGLHFHRGLTIRDRQTLTAYVSGVLSFCDDLHRRTGWHPEILDLGGSLACPTVSSIPPRQYRFNRALGTDLLPPDPAVAVGLADASTIAATMVADHFAAAGRPSPRVVLEPGRALSANTQLLLTTVVDVKEDGQLAHAVLDAGIGVAEPVPNEYHQLFSVSAPAAAATTGYRLVGPICTPMDVLYNHWRLPRLEVGHVLAIMDSGAYFIPQSTAFSFPRAPVVLQDGAAVVPCRRRETFDDMVRCDDLPTDHP